MHTQYNVAEWFNSLNISTRFRLLRQSLARLTNVIGCRLSIVDNLLHTDNLVSAQLGTPCVLADLRFRERVNLIDDSKPGVYFCLSTI